MPVERRDNLPDATPPAEKTVQLTLGQWLESGCAPRQILNVV